MSIQQNKTPYFALKAKYYTVSLSSSPCDDIMTRKGGLHMIAQLSPSAKFKPLSTYFDSMNPALLLSFAFRHVYLNRPPNRPNAKDKP